MSLCTSSLRADSLFPTVLWFSWNPVGFQGLLFRELVSFMQDLRVEVPDMDHKPPLLRKYSMLLRSLSIMYHYTWGRVFFGETMSLPLLPTLILSFMSFVVKALFFWFSGPFQRKLFHI